ncbi:SigE family RNA polymerase sigma factor [Rugosimonospora africana]|uniref:RNA polymerase sigma factor n=1 Tax=Rugosimonospora africana TaxID=556532 RepID=A0A8J3VRV6_9ACTN|nr:SigE family RNA polymerase sigma factor [Rugosimonospora africana]GIH15778.1 RNA polymerase sigma factor [Rugosimonospora africana]
MTDRPEYDRFVAERSPRLLRVAYLMTSDWGTAEDLLQSALIKAWFAWSRVCGDPEAYVRRIIVTTHISSRRRRRTAEIPWDDPDSRRSPAGADLAGAYSPDLATQQAERDAVWQALRRLPRRQRAILVLRYLEDLTEAQTAQALGIAVGTVKGQASRALAKLREISDLRPQSEELTR